MSPPPVLVSCRVLESALLGRKVGYTGHSDVYSDGREVGPVPRLAIVEALNGGEIMLLHCGRNWNVKAVAAYASVKGAKQRAERIYPGVSDQWKKSGVSKAQAKAYLARAWKGMECSFCSRRPDQVQHLISKGSTRVCDVCVREFYGGLNGG